MKTMPKKEKKDYQRLKYSVTKEVILPEGISVRQANCKHMFVLTLLKTSIQMRQVYQACKEHKLSHEMYNLCLTFGRGRSGLRPEKNISLFISWLKDDFHSVLRSLSTLMSASLTR